MRTDQGPNEEKLKEKEEREDEKKRNGRSDQRIASRSRTSNPLRPSQGAYLLIRVSLSLSHCTIFVCLYVFFVTVPRGSERSE